MIIGRLKSYFMIQKNYIKLLKQSGVQIGEKCEIYPSASFGSEPYLIHIGDHVRVNNGVCFVTHDGGSWVLRKYLNDDKSDQIDLFGHIYVGNNVHIGTNAIIMPGVSIGDNCIIGCGAIVTKDIPENSIAVGVPARVIETLDEYIEKHRKDFFYTKHLSPDEKRKYLIEHFGGKGNV